jgi:protein-S-isoprenylcysteine O-methyltransferase Ste14
MGLDYGRVIPALWLSWVVLWAAWSRRTKAAVRQESRRSRLSYNLPLLAAAVLLATPRQGRPSAAGRGIGAVGVAAGLGFAVVARAEIGRNWSSSVTVKQGHELVQVGPYRLVRHPIYTGLLLALLGTAVARGDGRGLAGLLLAAASFLRKIGVEERFMAERFPREYPGYRARTPALVPGLRRL